MHPQPRRFHPAALISIEWRSLSASARVDFGGNEFVRVSSWIGPFCPKRNQNDPRSHTKQHEPKYLRIELDVTFEAKLLSVSN
jgi:hypothetical protein